MYCSPIYSGAKYESSLQSNNLAFTYNTLIQYFDEFSLFGNTNLNAFLGNRWFTGCTNLKRIGLDCVTAWNSNNAYHPLNKAVIKEMRLPNAVNFVNAGYLVRAAQLPYIERVFFGAQLESMAPYIFSSANATAAKPLLVVILAKTPPTTNASGGVLAAWAANLRVYIPDEAFESGVYTNDGCIFANNVSRVFPLSDYPYPEELLGEL